MSGALYPVEFLSKYGTEFPPWTLDDSLAYTAERYILNPANDKDRLGLRLALLGQKKFDTFLTLADSVAAGARCVPAISRIGKNSAKSAASSK